MIEMSDELEKIPEKEYDVESSDVPPPLTPVSPDEPPPLGGAIHPGAETGKSKTRDPRYLLKNYKMLGTPNTIRLIICFTAAILVLDWSFEAASRIFIGGALMERIGTSDGKKINESFYNDMGIVCQGLSSAIRAFGVFGACVLARMGIPKAYN
jgi:hypothetical protein